MVNNTQTPTTRDKRVGVDTTEQPNVFLRRSRPTSLRYLRFQKYHLPPRIHHNITDPARYHSHQIPIEGEELDVLTFRHGLVRALHQDVAVSLRL